VWKNKIAVLMGDYLLSTGLMISLNHDDVYFLKVTSDSVRRMSEGEILQIQKSRELNIDESTYLKIISNKTASLLSTCSEIGAASVTENAAVRKAMKEYGENVGMAFQIRDDILDFTSRKSILGKPIGGDMKEKKITLPLIHALKQSSKQDARKVLKMIKSGAKDKDVEFIVDFVKKNGGIQYAEQCAHAYGNAARECLKTLPPSDAKESLEFFIDFVMEREK
ncbi:MAG: polyprenyl synthetase family protein, partial [Bacteroidota bacterium]